MAIERLTPDRHLQTIKRILHHIIRVELVHLAHDNVDIRLLRLREEQKLGPRHRLEARQPEQPGLQHLEPGELTARDRLGLGLRLRGRGRISDC